MSLVLSLSLSLVSLSAFAWTTHGPTGGTVLDATVATSNPLVEYLTTPGGIARSDDAGATWHLVTNGLSGVQYIAVDPLDANRVYVTTSTGVARSSNGGATWTNVPLGGSSFLPAGLKVDRFDSNILYTGGGCDAELFTTGASGFWRSTDRGVTWSFIQAPGTCIGDLTVDPVSSSIYVDSQNGRTLRSADRATTFEASNTPLPTHVIVADPRNQAVRFGIARGLTELLTSSDSGATWTPTGSPLGIGLNDLAVDPDTGRLFLATTSGLLRSGNGGQSWAHVDTLPASNVGKVLLGSNSITLGTASGVFRSTDGMVTWNRIDTGDIGTSIAVMAIDPSNPATMYVRTWSGSLFETFDFGNSWTYFGEMPNAALVVDAGGQLYASIVNGKSVYRRDGDGWDHILETPGPNFSFVADGQVPGRLWLSSQGLGLLVTQNGGQNFSILTSLGHNALFNLAADPARANTLYVRTDHLSRSTDGGVTWTTIDAPFVFNYIAPPPSDASFVYAWSGTSLFRVDVTGGGTKIADFPDSVTDLVVDPLDANTLYIATTNRGIFRSSDGGVTWTSFGDLNAYRLAIDRTALMLHAGTVTQGVWEQRLGLRPRALRLR